MIQLFKWYKDRDYDDNLIYYLFHVADERVNNGWSFTIGHRIQIRYASFNLSAFDLDNSKPIDKLDDLRIADLFSYCIEDIFGDPNDF